MNTLYESVLTEITKNRDRYVSELCDLLRIPSVSADPAFAADVRRCANLVMQQLKAAGADAVELIETKGHPVVFGEKWVSNDLPTVLVYGHYDVQPADPINLWNSPPFEPVITDGKIYARGAADDKGQFFMHVKALEILSKLGHFPCNLKFMIEGEEEVGSAHLGEFVAANREKLHANVILVSDTALIANDCPSITTGLRGLCYMEVEVTGPKKDLHSGIYGGAVHNPANVLCEIVAQLKDRMGAVTIPGFYDRVVKLSPAERAEMAKAPFDESEYKTGLGIEATYSEAGYSPREGASIRPTLDVNGMWSGYTGEGAKTVLPSKAYAKISMRLVPNQDPDEIAALFTKHVKQLAPPSVTVKVTTHHGGTPVVIPTDFAGYAAASRAMEQTFGVKPIPERGGGSIPIVALFEKELGLKTILMGFGLDEDDIHSPNEHYGVFNFLKGIETIALFFEYFREEQAKAAY